MNGSSDRYLQALKDVAAALDALNDTALNAAMALNMDSVGEEDYDFAAHRTAVDRHNGVCAAVIEVYGMLDRHRNSGAA